MGVNCYHVRFPPFPLAECKPECNKATIFLFLGLRISWPENRVGRSEKKIKIIKIRPYYVKL